MRSVVHLSDLHFGRVDETLLSPLVSRVVELTPDVVVVSGDLTQRARVSQFTAARAFLDRLPSPQIIVPGNHDVPLYDVVRRFLAPLNRYRTYISDDLEPFHADEEIAVVGVNTSRSLTFKGGRINEEQIERVRARMCQVPDSTMKLMVTHHPFDVPLSEDQDDRVGRANLAMNTLASCGVDVLMSGHLHASHSGSTGKRFGSAVRPVVLVQAGTATSTRGRGESNSFNHLVLRGGGLMVQRYDWDEKSGTFVAAHIEQYEKRSSGWISLATA